MSATFTRIYEIVRSVPWGKVASYGQIAAMAGYPRGAQMVGWALHQLDANGVKKVPWHRIVNTKGEITTTCREHSAQSQKELLEAEGLVVERMPSGLYRVDIEKYRFI